MALDIKNSNIVIKNNIIGPGQFDTNTYKYNSHVSAYTSSNISENTFIGPDEDTDMLSITNCSCSVFNNKFIRGTTAITAYINISGTDDQNIVENVFDKTTVDGYTNETLVAGLTSASIYERNINQTAYTLLSILDDIHGVSHVAGLDYIYSPSAEPNGAFFSREGAPGRLLGSGGIPNLGRSGINYLRMFEGASNDDEMRGFHKVFNLNKSLPNNITILQLKLGIKLTAADGSLDVTSGANPERNNMFVLRIAATKDILTSNTTGIVDPAANIDQSSTISGSPVESPHIDLSEEAAHCNYFQIHTSGGGGFGFTAANTTYEYEKFLLEDFAAGTKYLTFTNSSTQHYRTGAANNRRIAAVVELYLKSDSATSVKAKIEASPLLVKYRW